MRPAAAGATLGRSDDLPATILHSEAIDSVLRYIVENPEGRGKKIAISVQSERKELRKQKLLD